MDPTTTTTTLATVTDQAKAVAQQAVPAIQQIAQEMLKWLREAHDFTVEQAPDLARQIIAWGIAEGIVYAVFALGWLLAGIWGLRWSIRHLPENWWEGEDLPPAIFGAILAGLIMPFAVLVLFDNVWWSVRAMVAPKVFLIEYLSKLVSK